MKSALIVLAVILLGVFLVAAQPNLVEICHQTGSGWITISVAPPSLPAHLGHGDYLGACIPDDDPEPPVVVVVETSEFVPSVSVIVLAVYPVTGNLFTWEYFDGTNWHVVTVDGIVVLTPIEIEAGLTYTRLAVVAPADPDNFRARNESGQLQGEHSELSVETCEDYVACGQ